MQLNADVEESSQQQRIESTNQVVQSEGLEDIHVLCHTEWREEYLRWEAIQVPDTIWEHKEQEQELGYPWCLTEHITQLAKKVTCYGWTADHLTEVDESIQRP